MSVVNSDVEICNLALLACGATGIDTLDDDTQEAKICKLIYKSSRDNFIRKHNWNFATKTLSLTLSVETTIGYASTFQLPDDYLKFVQLIGTQYKTKIVGDKLATNATSVSIEYIARIENVTLYPADFVEAFSLAMAMKMIYKFNQSINAKQSLQTDAKNALREARTADGQEGTMPDMMQDTWIDSRLGAADGFGNVKI